MRFDRYERRDESDRLTNWRGKASTKGAVLSGVTPKIAMRAVTPERNLSGQRWPRVQGQGRPARPRRVRLAAQAPQPHYHRTHRHRQELPRLRSGTPANAPRAVHPAAPEMGGRDTPFPMEYLVQKMTVPNIWAK